jgi:hypothetical protein
MRLSFENLYALISPEFFGFSVHIKGSNRFKKVDYFRHLPLTAFKALKFRYHYLFGLKTQTNKNNQSPSVWYCMTFMGPGVSILASNLCLLPDH